MPYRRIVVGSDGSPRAEQAVREAAALAAVGGGRLTVVAAYTRRPRVERELDGPLPPDVRWALTDRENAEQKAAAGAAVARDAGATDVEVLSEEGTPAEVLLRVVEDGGADLLVVGSRGMTDASRFVIGSVANTVSHHARCDVLIVHTKGDT